MVKRIQSDFFKGSPLRGIVTKMTAYVKQDGPLDHKHAPGIRGISENCQRMFANDVVMLYRRGPRDRGHKPSRCTAPLAKTSRDWRYAFNSITSSGPRRDLMHAHEVPPRMAEIRSSAAPGCRTLGAHRLIGLVGEAGPAASASMVAVPLGRPPWWGVGSTISTPLISPSTRGLCIRWVPRLIPRDIFPERKIGPFRRLPDQSSCWRCGRW
jgi:hypothetical protein